MQDNSQKTLKARYNGGTGTREQFLEKARECARVTIPALLRETEGASKEYKDDPYQSFGADGVNSLSAKIVTTLFPPNEVFFKQSIDEINIEKYAKEEGQKSAISAGLAKVERVVMDAIEASPFRSKVQEAVKLLLVTGNSVISIMPTGIRVFKLDQYVQKLDSAGNLLSLIIREKVSPLVLPESVIEAVDIKKDNKDELMKDVDVFTGVERQMNGKFKVWQEINGKDVPDAVEIYDEDELPFISLRFNPVDGECYGRGLAEDYLGDLQSLENLSRSIVQGSMIAAKVVFMTNNPATAKQLTKARNGQVISGNPGDVRAVQSEKQADLRIAREAAEAIEQRLARSWLMVDGIQRNAERVTAEEIRLMANELETRLGGLYSQLATQLQLPVANIFISMLERQNKIPSMQALRQFDDLKINVTTGINALGRGQDINKLAQFINTVTALTNTPLIRFLNQRELMVRVATGYGIDTTDLIKTEEQIEQEEQAAANAQMAQEVMSKAAPGVANTMAKAAVEPDSQ